MKENIRAELVFAIISLFMYFLSCSFVYVCI